MDRDIKPGTIGLDVYGIQQRLSNLGYQLKVDGIMGKQTLTAVNKLFTSNNLPAVNTLTKDAQKKLLDLYNQNITKSIQDTQLQAAIAQLQNLLK